MRHVTSGIITSEEDMRGMEGERKTNRKGEENNLGSVTRLTNRGEEGRRGELHDARCTMMQI